MTLAHKEDRSPEQPPANSSEAGPSELPPPSFQESGGDRVVAFDQVPAAFPEGGEEPPQFELYDAEHWVSWSGNKIISHDPHLNEDGEALYRFLLSQAETPPTFAIHCRGTHNETRTRLVTKTDPQGRQHTEMESYTITIVDFDFNIRQPVPPYATQWTVADDEPAYRGHMSRQVGLPGDTIKVDRATMKQFKAWRAERETRGLPPWVSPEDDAAFRASAVQRSHSNVLKSSWTLRQWADDYCQSRNIFKEFVYEKIIYGWDLGTLESAIRAVIQSTHYNGDRVEVSFKSGHRTVIVRPDRTISRAISNPCLKFLLIITFIYPCIWLFQRFYWRGGGRWGVGGSAYALRREADVAESGVIGCGEDGGGRTVIGETEEEWMRRWENTIRRSVMDRRVVSAGLIEPNWS